jgi:hypothetical protein
VRSKGKRIKRSEAPIIAMGKICNDQMTVKMRISAPAHSMGKACCNATIRREEFSITLDSLASNSNCSLLSVVDRCSNREVVGRKNTAGNIMI